jgi:hypothetical protein
MIGIYSKALRLSLSKPVHTTLRQAQVERMILGEWA